MKMTKLLLATSLFVASATQAQKVDLDRFNFQGSYRQLPKYPLGTEFTTQSVTINATSSVKDGMSEGEMTNAINVEGYKKITGRAHLNINVFMDDVMIESSDVSERIEETKNKEGVVTSRKSYFKVTSVYSFSARATAVDHNGKELGKWDLASRGSKKSWSSNEYNTRNEAAEYFNNNKYAIRNQLSRQEATNVLGGLNNALNGNYGYVSRRVGDFLWIIDNKKHPENDAAKAAWTKFKEAMALVTPDEVPQEAKDKLLEVVKYFDDVKARYTADEKADKKFRYSSFYNNAKIYIYLDMPEAAIKEAEGLIANDYDGKDGKYLKEDAESIIAFFKKNNTTTRHFKINLDKAEAPKSNP